MKRRERLLATINHIEPDRIPIGFDIHEEKKKEMEILVKKAVEENL